MVLAEENNRNLKWPIFAIIVIALLMAGCSNKKSSETNGAEQKDGIRTIQDAYGDVKVPASPVRIVALDIGALDNLLALNIKPVGGPSILTAGAPFPSYLKDSEGIKNIGSVNEPNLEAIDSLKPDLIIGNKDTHDAIRNQLTKIAPTVLVESLGVTWKNNLKLHAESVNKAADGDQLLKAYEKRISELKAKLNSKKSVEVSLIRPRADKTQLYLKGTFAGVIMEDAGIVRPAAQSGSGFSKDVTQEQIADLDGDVILWFNREKDAFAKLQSSPLWATLKGAKNNKIYPVEWEYWMSGLGIQAVNKVIDDLDKYVAQ